MALPAYGEVDLALLLELVRAGKPVRPAEVYDRVSVHFPLLSPEDKTAVRRDGRTRVWLNMIHWARDHLRIQGVLADAGTGRWAVNSSGRAVLCDWLEKRGVRNPQRFIDTTETLAEVLGREWARLVRERAGGPEKQPRAVQKKRPGEPPSADQPPSSLTLADIQHHEMEAARATLLGRLLSMEPRDFENFVGRVLDALGFRSTEVVGRPADGGIDVRTVLENELVSATVVVQVKRQQNNVGPKEISYLRDRWARRADKLLFVTTSDFTAGAREVASEHDMKPVQLVTGNELTDIMIQHRIGVVAHTVERLELDEEFLGG